MDPVNNPVEAHYTIHNLFEKILAALEHDSIDRRQISYRDIAAVDQFHIGGIEASREMARLAALPRGSRVLDVGCGIGGPCRMLAEEFGCRVIGVDLTAEYIRTAKELSRLAGLDTVTDFIQADARALPFDQNRFDAVWTQHAQMNISQKEALYAEIARVLRPGGHFIYHDVLAGPRQPVYYPTPWADQEAASFLLTPEQLHELLGRKGFRPLHCLDFTSGALSFFEKMFGGQAAATPSGPTLRLLMGDQAPQKMKQLYQNLQEGRVLVEGGVWEK
ncbi:MAG TPA: class I SAM-dependent methyltransferase [Chitinophagaceae bacterium]|nr:class I SAM-dependent methyltransferase [Chitinophagaceae bacterium]